MAFLTLTNINKVFATTTVVEDFNLHVEKGEFVTFLGPSGCGKTTTLRMVAGFEIPTRGRITVNGQDITSKPPNQRNVGMVFQSYALFPNMTVADNIGFGLKVARRPAQEIHPRVAEMLNLIHMPEFGKRYPYQLSGGQQQRVALARALAVRPQVLLLDEPLSALDAKIRFELRSEIRRIQQDLSITTIYVTHDQEEALSLSDRIVVMNAGKIEQIGTPLEIYNFPRTAFTASFVGHLNLFKAKLSEASGGYCAMDDGQVFRISESIGSKGTDTQVHLALRPEEIGLGKVDSRNNLSGEVQEVTYLGALVRLRVKVGNTSLLADLFNERMVVPPVVGEQVYVNFPIHACWVVA